MVSIYMHGTCTHVYYARARAIMRMHLGFHHATTIEQLIERLENRELPTDVAQVAIDGRKWIASRFQPVMFSERVQLHLTVNKDNLQEEHLKALKARAQKRLEEQNRQKCFNPN